MKAGAKPSGLPLETGGKEAQGEAAGEPAAEEVDRFRAFLRAPAPGSAVLAGLASGPPPEPSPAALLVEELAERLLVGEEDEGGGGGGDAVRVVAKDVGIPGLEVVVRREGGGLLVELMAPHPADLALLRRGAADLVARLEARFGTRAEVRVTRRGGEDAGP